MASWFVVASSDDAHRRLAPSQFSTTNTFQYCGDYDATYYDYGGGFRWLNITIPKSSTIDTAYLKLRGSSRDGSIPTIVIHGEAVDDAATFSTLANYDGRTRTTASVSWTPGSWSTNGYNTSDDISTIIQEIVNRDGWASGNDLVLFVSHASGWGGTQCRVHYCAYDEGPGDFPAELEITWTPPAAGISIPVAMHHYNHHIHKIIRG